MPDHLTSPASHLDRGHWVRLRTLVTLRWVAVFGQTGAVIVADRMLNLSFEASLCYLVIGISVMVNIVASFLFPENTRLTERQVLAILIFDVAQLCLLIFLTGGLNNPFTLLVLAPVAVGASALGLGAMAGLAGLTMVMITIVSFVHRPLLDNVGREIQVPQLVEIGFLMSILIGVVFVSVLIRRIWDETHVMSEALMATQLALSREQKLTDLGGIVAATAHELGTPLATIKLVSSELTEELEAGSELQEDARLIGAQADRCRDILRDMGRAGNDDRYLKHVPLSAVVEEAAQPHIDRGKVVEISALSEAGDDAEHPVVRRAPEVMHGLRNLIQNAVDFAESTVWVDVRWSKVHVTVTIADDGPGFPGHLIGRIGDPFMKGRSRNNPSRPAYEGMGLGLFIAKTLLERSGADLSFANGTDPFLTAAETSRRKGAVVQVYWSAADICVSAEEIAQSQGENEPLTM